MSGSQRARPWGRALALVGALVAADQTSKYAVATSLAPGERLDLPLGLELAEVTNRGIAFGLLGGGGALVLAVTAAALAAVLLWFALNPARPGLWLGVGLLAGGAMGNLADRVRDGAVVDFLDPPLWPAFNLADVAITLGAIALALAALRGDASAPGDRS